MVRLSIAGMGVNVPTLEVTTVTGGWNPPAARPLKSVATLIGHGPSRLPVQWVPEIVTRPVLADRNVTELSFTVEVWAVCEVCLPDRGLSRELRLADIVAPLL